MLFPTQEYRERWSATTKLIFRFIFTYLVLYILLMFGSSLFETPFRWIAKSIFQIDYSFNISGQGSGDHTYAYITLFVNAVLTIIISFIWSVLDRKRISYNKLFYWFLVLLRIFLVVFMFLYGFVKIFKLQFPSASLMRLLQPLGDFSPMGLAWTYMGYSEGFNMFAGFMEVLGGLLLIPRRTQTLGAFLVMGVMTHVAVMNFMFDIPVKLFSIHLVLMATVIFTTDIKRFISVFINNKPTEKYQFYNPITNKRYHKIIFWTKIVLITVAVIFSSVQGYTTERKLRDKRPKPALYGIWKAQTFIKNGDTLKPLITDTYRWRYLVRDYGENVAAKLMNDSIIRFTFKMDTVQHKMTIYNRGADVTTFNFDYSQPEKNSLNLKGTLNGDSLKIHLTLKDPNEFELKRRGFHWINEYPRNK